MIDAGAFVISSSPYVASDFMSINLGGGHVLSFHESLPVCSSKDGSVHLLGLAWQTEADHRDPVDELDDIAHMVKLGDEAAILKTEATWCGRYVLIAKEHIYLDACGMLGVFYGFGCVSNSMHVLVQHLRLQTEPLEVDDWLNWLPGPLTHVEGILRLLPSQVLNYYEEIVHVRQLLPNGVPSFANAEAAADSIIARFDISLRNMQRLLDGKSLRIALTGGHDSRTLLALARHAGIDFSCFTLERKGAAFLDDMKIPPVLCEKLGVSHELIFSRETERSDARRAEYRIHTFGYANDADVERYARVQYETLAANEDVVCLRSSVWGIAIEYYRWFIGSSLDIQRAIDGLRAYKNTIAIASLNQYAQWMRESPQIGINDRDRFFWEQREGCWLSSIEQGLDLIKGVTSLQPCNCRTVIAALLSFPESDRMSKKYEEYITQRACPALTEIPYGNEEQYMGLLEKTIPKMRRLGYRLRHLGIRKALLVYRDIVRVKKRERQERMR